MSKYERPRGLEKVDPGAEEEERSWISTATEAEGREEERRKVAKDSRAEGVKVE